jgi:hypothetical protein
LVVAEEFQISGKFGEDEMRQDILESPPFGRVPLNKAGAPTYPYDILKDF